MSQIKHNPIPIEALAVYPLPGMATPTNITFSNDNSQVRSPQVRSPQVRFLTATADDPVQQLYAMDVQSGEIRVLVAPPGGGVKEENLSLEEELRRQRERMLATGITHYTPAEKSDRLLIPVSGDIYVWDSENGLRLIVSNVGKPPALTPAISSDGRKIAYVQDAELYVVAVDGGEAVQLTYGARGTGRTHGLAEFIAQEELHRGEGFWWSPEGDKIAYTEVDETHIPVYRIMHQGKDTTGDGAQEDHRYPFAGEPNALVKLFVIPAEGGEPVEMDMGFEDEVYIARVFWWDNAALGAQIVNRLQDRTWLVKWDTNGIRTTVLDETSPYWINVRTDIFHVLDDGGHVFDKGCFIFGSERDGFNHLYLYAANGELIRQLTRGEWLVDALNGVDEENGLVYFTASKDSPLEAHLYSVRLDGGDAYRSGDAHRNGDAHQNGDVRKITTEAGMHSITLDHNCKYFIDAYQALDTAPTVWLKSLETGEIVHVIHTPSDPRIAEFDLTPPELVELQNRDGVTLYGAIYRPPEHFTPPYPVIVSLYGGPGPQMVANKWLMTVRMREQYLRNQGYLVFTLDNRGSARRGLEFEGALKHCMGTIEVDDQVDGVRWLVDQGLADPERIGVIGWSYGGYMTLMCLAKAPDVFKMGVSGAPVTAWDGYDTCYTERYMSTPQLNPEGYANGSVMNYVENIRGKLLLVHGLLDENVHFRHTARLMNALIRKRIPYDILLFPDERHMPRRETDRVYMHEQIIQYFESHL